MSTVFKDKHVKIRKPQFCYGCLDTFEPGTVMRYRAGVYDGDFWATYDCWICEHIKENIIDNDEELTEGWTQEYYYMEYEKLKREKNES